MLFNRGKLKQKIFTQSFFSNIAAKSSTRNNYQWKTCVSRKHEKLKVAEECSCFFFFFFLSSNFNVLLIRGSVNASHPPKIKLKSNTDCISFKTLQLIETYKSFIRFYLTCIVYLNTFALGHVPAKWTQPVGKAKLVYKK